MGALSREEKLKALYAISLEISAQLDLNLALQTIVREAAHLLEARSSDISLYDPAREILTLVAYHGPEKFAEPSVFRLGEGVVGTVAQTGQPLIVNDYQHWERGHPLSQNKGITIVMGVPLRWREEFIGVLCVNDDTPGRSFSEEDLWLLELLAPQVAIVLSNAWLYTEVKRRAEEMTALYQTSLEIAAQLDLSKLLYSIVERATALLNVKYGSIYIYDEEKDELELGFCYNFEKDLSGTRLTRGEGLAGKVLESGKTMYVRDYRHWEGRSLKYEGYPFVSVLAVPLKWGERILGVLNASEDKERTFSEEEVRLIELFANQAAIAFGNARLFAESKRLQQDLQDKLHQLQQTQAQLIQAEKLSALGQLISGIAHELNNPLTVVMGYAQLLEAEALSPSARESLRQISTSAERARHIIHSLLTFAREHQAQRRLTSLNDILEQSLNLYAYQLKVNNIEVVTKLDRKLPYTVVDPYQMQQVFLNIIINAEQAMSEAHGRGKLIITSRQVGKDTIRLEFCDDGPGIPPEIIGKIFDPFFTTKPLGKGTGLGLSICFGIVTEHGGRIWAENNESHGATFFIELPVGKEEPLEEEIRREALPEARRPHGPAQILLIEDEEEVAYLLQRILRERGHQVELAENGEKALEKLKEKSYDLLISGLRMPGLSGSQLYEHLKGFRPELARRIIFITGDIIGPQTRDFLEMTGSFYLRKPFYVEEVWEAVEKVLGNL